MLQHRVVLKIAVANRLVQHHLQASERELRKALAKQGNYLSQTTRLVYDIGVSANPGVNLCLKVGLQSSDRYFFKKVLSNHQLDHSLGLGKKILTTNFSVARRLRPTLNTPNSQGINKVSCTACHFRESCSQHAINSLRVINNQPNKKLMSIKYYGSCVI